MTIILRALSAGRLKNLVRLALLLSLVLPEAGRNASFSQAADSTSQDQALYEKVELLHLSQDIVQERETSQEFLRLYPQSQYAPKIKFRLARTGLINTASWDASVEALLEVERDYPGTSFATSARQIHDALTKPASAKDLAVLAQEYKWINASGQSPVTETFLIHRMYKFYAEQPVLDWIKSDSGMDDFEKSALAYDMAEMMYRDPMRSEYQTSRNLCGWILENYPGERHMCNLALRLSGLIDIYYRKPDLAAAEEAFRKIKVLHADDDYLSDCFCTLAHFYFLKKDYKKAQSLLDEVREKWPLSRGSYRAYTILCRREMVENSAGAQAGDD